MKTLLFLLGAAVMVQAWPLDVDNVAADKPKFEGTKDGTKPLSGFFAGEDGVAGPINDVVDKPGPEESEPKQDESKSADSEHIVEVIPEMPSREERESTSNIFKCDVTKPITAELTINFHQVQDPAPKPEPTCMANWDYCLGFGKPCCDQHSICFKFGEGICTPLHEIRNLDSYGKLIKELNSTNFDELHKKYWDPITQFTHEE
ncbi:cysteine-rich protein [Ichnoviriform sonorense]|uniref:Cysteine-rich protein n=3 Tax=Campoletis sonorensis ichnovirus TaxID=10484 RepID=Q77ZH4_CSIVT|nr:cysteine-rich protein [Ichnoviriform sonorense]AAA66405.1 unknown protein [Ichnoviriform sonorense]AAC58527.1 cysteine-rich protein [Ichnoviriform sonorense]prf//1506536B WHv2 gene [Ichnoviriform sonorense]